MAGWYALEEVYLIRGKPFGLIRRGASESEWDASIGEAFSNNIDDHIIEVEHFTSKRLAKEWVVDRLVARGYIRRANV